MIRETLKYNESVKPNTFEIERLRAALPEYFDTDGNFMLDRFQETLKSGDVDLTREGYELKFLGKSYAKYLTSTKTETVIVPDVEHNKRPENQNSENLYIVGDNLDALKHLLGSYAGQVKCIYIDPPYNTGTDGFTYNDDFGFTAEELINKVGLSEDEASRVLDLRGKSSHSAWLTFMYPRLQLAKELLADDGVIFISIDDNEQANLKQICDEIFGEQAFMADFILDKGNSKSDSGDVQKNHEYILAYRSPRFDRSSGAVLQELRQKEKTVYEHGGRFFYLSDPITTRAKGGVLSARPKLGFTIYVHPESLDLIPIHDYDLDRASDPSAGVEIYEDNQELIEQGYIPVRPPAVRGQLGAWTWSLNKVKAESENLYPSGAPESGYAIKKRIYVSEMSITKKGKRLVTESTSHSPARSLLKFSTNDGADRFSRLMPPQLFDYPKNTDLLKHLISMCVDSGDIVLDFFSGSASSADAILQFNAESHSNLRFIQVQIAEPITNNAVASSLGFTSIDQVGRERINKAAKQIKSDTGVEIDYGFKLHRIEALSSDTIDTLDRFDPDAEATLFAGDYLSKFEINGISGHDTVLTTWMAQDGYGVTRSAQKRKLVNYHLDVCDDTAYIIEPGLSSLDVVELVRLIENGELNVARVVVFGYSVTFGVMHELKKNLSVLKSGRTVSVLERL